MKLRAAVDQFHRGYFATHRRSPRTQKAYATDLKQFLAFVGKGKQLEALTSRDLERWAHTLQVGDYAPASVRRKFAALGVFLRYWESKGKIGRSPLRGLHLDLPSPKNLPRTISEKEVRSLLGQAQRELRYLARSEESLRASTKKRLLALRNLAMLRVLIATGIRVGELTGLRLKDYDPHENSLLITGKGAKERLVCLPDSGSQKTLEHYLHARCALTADSIYIFLNYRGVRLSSQGVAKIVSQLATKAGIEQRVTPHILRHSVATMLVRNGANLRIVQELLGHASVRTTQRYVSVSKKHLFSAIKRLHPVCVETLGSVDTY